MKLLLLLIFLSATAFTQVPPVEPGVSHELAKWRAARYSDVRYKLDLTLKKMSPVLKGTMEIRVRVEEETTSPGTPPPGTQAPSPANAGSSGVANVPIILDWRSIRGSEKLSTISNVTINGTYAVPKDAKFEEDISGATILGPRYQESNEHLIFDDHVVIGENIIKLDFTSPILASGSAITRYVDKEDGAEYIYSLFVPSDASTAFPVFDQPDLKAKFALSLKTPDNWTVVSNATAINGGLPNKEKLSGQHLFGETIPISTYVFAFSAGEFVHFSEKDRKTAFDEFGMAAVAVSDVYEKMGTHAYVRKSQASKFKPHAAEVFRLNREGIKFLESYFDYKFPFPKYDIVLIPEFPFGGMEHAGATFLREASVIFPQEPTKNDYISRANLIFHEAAHQWFGDTVTMKWFDDLWLKEGFAEFMAYKTLEKVMPEYNAWKVFYERNKQAAYLTDSTKGTTPIYQEISNLNSAKSAYGNIVYRKAPSFLKQAEFFLGADKFQTAVRAFLKKHEYSNASWEDLVTEFENASGWDSGQLNRWATQWVKQRGVPKFRISSGVIPISSGDPDWSYLALNQSNDFESKSYWPQRLQVLMRSVSASIVNRDLEFSGRDVGQRENGVWTRGILDVNPLHRPNTAPFSRREPLDSFIGKVAPDFVFPNYDDNGYGIFLLDPKSRDYVLKNIQNEKDDFLRTMMWGSLWDSVREGELDPREYVELVVKTLKVESDESTIQTLLGRVSTAMRYYIDDDGVAAVSVPPAAAGGSRGNPRRRGNSKNRPAPAGGTDLLARVESLLIDRMQNAATPGQKITYYRAFLSIASSERARRILKQILEESQPGAMATGSQAANKAGSNRTKNPVATAPGSDMRVTTKDKFDIVSRLIILGDPEATKLLAELERTETSDEAKRYAYAARAGFATAENKAKFWDNFVNNKDISESWIEAAFGPFNNVRHSDLTLPYLEKSLAELPNLKRNRKIFFVNGWLGAFIGGQRSERALTIVNKFLADNPGLDNDLRLKILENVDVIERAVKIRAKHGRTERR